jgi:antitoxin (DNA-binding transcriptional repressor) of toxin-antitoxin stability system
MGTPSRDHEVLRFGVNEARTPLSELIDQAGEGNEIIISGRGRDLAHLATATEHHSREVGCDAGLVWISEDFDAALPEDMLTDIT